MKPRIYFTFFLVLFLIFPIMTLFATISIDVTYPAGGVLSYNRFLVADLGLLGEGKSNKIFEIRFGSDTSTDSYYLHIKVTDNSNGKVLLEGNTESWPYNERFSGQTYTNYNITEAASLGGSFSISDESKTLQDKILATGALPEGTFTISFELKKASDNSTVDTAQITVNIDPPYLQPIYPVNNYVTPSSLVFRWRSNLSNLSLHIYSDPRGKNEVKSGSRLPAGVSGGMYDGTSIATLLSYGKTYYWQITGDINTSHGTETLKGPVSSFILKTEGSGGGYFGLSEGEKAQIKARLIKLLKSKINKRAARSIRSFNLDRVLLDNSEISLNEILNILEMLEKGKLKVKSVYFK